MMSSMKEYDEKRSLLRMRVGSKIQVRACDTEESYDAVCRNLSGTGMGLQMDRRVAEGTEFTTSLPSASEHFPALDALIRVVRCVKEEDDRFLVGVEIVRINEH